MYVINLGLLMYFLDFGQGTFQLKERDMSFCDALQWCEDQGGALPTTADLAALRRDMNSWEIPGTWVTTHGHPLDAIRDNCRTTNSQDPCPGTMALPSAQYVLRPPLADCHHSYVDLAICHLQNDASRLSWYSLDDDSPIDSFCDALRECEGNGLTMPRSGKGNSNISGLLREKRRTAAWAVSVESLDNFRNFCSNAKLSCPGEIIFEAPRYFVDGPLVSCNTQIPVVCDIPLTTTEQPITESTPPYLTTTTLSKKATRATNVSTLNASQNANGENEDDSMYQWTIIIGVVSGVVVLAVVVFILICVFWRKKTGKKADMKSPTQTDIWRGSNEYQDTNELAQPRPMVSTHSGTEGEVCYDEIRGSFGNGGGFSDTYAHVNNGQPQSTTGKRGSCRPPGVAPHPLDGSNDVTSGPDEAAEGAVYAVSTKWKPRDIDPEEVTLAENTLYG